VKERNQIPMVEIQNVGMTFEALGWVSLNKGDQ